MPTGILKHNSPVIWVWLNLEDLTQTFNRPILWLYRDSLWVTKPTWSQADTNTTQESQFWRLLQICCILERNQLNFVFCLSLMKPKLPCLQAENIAQKIHIHVLCVNSCTFVSVSALVSKINAIRQLSGFTPVEITFIFIPWPRLRFQQSYLININETWLSDTVENDQPVHFN